MAILERHIQHVTNEKEYDVWEMKWAEFEKRIGGFPAKKHYNMLSGPESVNTIVWEREWESLGTMEATYMKIMGGEFDALAGQGQAFMTGERIELYFVRD